MKMGIAVQYSTQNHTSKLDRQGPQEKVLEGP